MSAPDAAALARTETAALEAIDEIVTGDHDARQPFLKGCRTCRVWQADDALSSGYLVHVSVRPQSGGCSEYVCFCDKGQVSASVCVMAEVRTRLSKKAATLRLTLQNSAVNHTATYQIQHKREILGQR